MLKAREIFILFFARSKALKELASSLTTFGIKTEKKFWWKSDWLRFRLLKIIRIKLKQLKLKK